MPNGKTSFWYEKLVLSWISNSFLRLLIIFYDFWLFWMGFYDFYEFVWFLKNSPFANHQISYGSSRSSGGNSLMNSELIVNVYVYLYIHIYIYIYIYMYICILWFSLIFYDSQRFSMKSYDVQWFSIILYDCYSTYLMFDNLWSLLTDSWW